MTLTGSRRRRGPSGGLLDSQVVWTCKAMIRWMHARELGAGDRLPPQEPLRQELGVGTPTIAGAMAALVESGMLSRRRSVGTVVEDLAAEPAGLWNVGVATFFVSGQGASSFFAHLSHRLEGGLLEAGARVRPYIRAFAADGPVPTVLYEDAVADLKHDAIDALLTTSLLVTDDPAHPDVKGKTAVHAGFDEHAPCGVVIDQGPMVREAMALLAARGCRRLAVLTTANLRASMRPRLLDALAEGLAPAGLAGSAVEAIHVGLSLEGGREAARQLLARPAKLRPQGLIVLDDWVCHALAATLEAAGTYRPSLVVQSNLQVPLGYALPVTRFEVDVEELAARAVGLTLDLARGRPLPRRIEWLPPRLHNRGAASVFPALVEAGA